MRLDSVSAIVCYSKVINNDGSFYYLEDFLKDYVYYGHGAADDAQQSLKSAEELNNRHKTVERYYKAVRIDFEDAVKRGLLWLT
jgi:hypothetical protein